MKSIGIKIGAGYLLAVALLVILGAASFRSVNRLQESSKWVSHTHKVLLALNQVQLNMVDAETGERGFVITGAEHNLEPYRQAVKAISTPLQQLRTLTGDNPVQQAKIANLDSLIRESLTILAETISLRRDDNTAAAQIAVKSNKNKIVMDKIRVLIADMNHIETTLLNERANQEQLTTHNFKTGIVLGIGLAILLLATACYLITTDIVRPLIRLTAVATEISRGKLDNRFSIGKRNDEVGLLADAFEKMGGYLANLAEAAQRIATGELSSPFTPQSAKDILGTSFETMAASLRRQVSEIDNSSRALLTASQEISTTTAQLSANTAEASTSVSQTTTSAEETRKIVGMVSDKTTDIARTADQMAEVADAGRVSTEKTVTAMQLIQEQMAMIADSIVGLSDQTQAIGEIITTVEELSEQSNLLAVNAAIEAAKVGDQGKGFAVVAQEIKNMAEKSKEATGRIRTILTDIQKAASSSVMVTEQGAKAVNAGSSQAAQTGETIATLAENLAKASVAANQILAAAQQQTIGMEQIVQAMKNIDTASRQNVTGADQLQDMVRNLDEMGRNLAAAIEQYKL